MEVVPWVSSAYALSCLNELSHSACVHPAGIILFLRDFSSPGPFFEESREARSAG